MHPSSLPLNAGCQNWLFYICLLIFYFWNCIHSQLGSSDFFLARDSEPAIYVSGEAGHQYIVLAHVCQKITESSQFLHTALNIGSTNAVS